MMKERPSRSQVWLPFTGPRVGDVERGSMWRQGPAQGAGGGQGEVNPGKGQRP